MNKYRDELYYVRDGKVMRCFDALLLDAESSTLEKSAATRVSEYNIDVTTLTNTTQYKNYRFSLNELEASFDYKTDELVSIELRDTSVHKKITFTSKKTTLTYAKGQDTVGQNSEWNTTTSKELVYSININGDVFNSPNPSNVDEDNILTNLDALYLSLTGFDLSERELSGESDMDNKDINWWTAFLNIDKKVQ
ncbi:putative coil containing protein [Vibrio phage 501E54-1]|nr:putative coil containing protein [Vibrio phage 501E54-1]